jgi:hypothetical protein
VVGCLAGSFQLHNFQLEAVHVFCKQPIDLWAMKVFSNLQVRKKKEKSKRNLSCHMYKREHRLIEPGLGSKASSMSESITNPQSQKQQWQLNTQISALIQVLQSPTSQSLKRS